MWGNQNCVRLLRGIEVGVASLAGSTKARQTERPKKFHFWHVPKRNEYLSPPNTGPRVRVNSQVHQSHQGWRPHKWQQDHKQQEDG